MSRTIQYLHRCLKTKDPLCWEQYNIYIMPKLCSYRSFPSTDGKLPISFKTFFQRCNDIHNAPTRFSKSECVHIPRIKSVNYGINSITKACIQSWNNFGIAFLALIIWSKTEMSNQNIQSHWQTGEQFPLSLLVSELQCYMVRCLLPLPFSSLCLICCCFFFHDDYTFRLKKYYPIQAR